MTLYERLESDMKAALKEGNAIKLSVLRMLISELRLFELEGKDKKLEEKDVLQVVQKHIRKHKESIEQFEKGKRPDLVDKEASELRILETYMPKQLGEEEIITVIKETMAETGLSAKSDTGKIMKAVMEKLRGRADGKLISQLVMGMVK